MSAKDTTCPHCGLVEAPGGRCSRCGKRPSDPVAETAPAKPQRPVKAAPAPVVPEVTGADIIRTIETAVYTSREAWLLGGVEAMRPAFEAIGFPVPSIRVSVGWPGGRGKKTGVIGQCWPTELAADGVHQVFISPVLTDSVKVLGTLAHEMVHAAVPKGEHHKGAFVKAAKALGLTAPWTATGESPELVEVLRGIADTLGPYDHAGLSSLGRQHVQSTRMLKVACPECGCVVRMARSWLTNAGAPTCACGTQMEEVTA